jgi:hypothetical protein
MELFRPAETLPGQAGTDKAFSFLCQTEVSMIVVRYVLKRLD